MINDFCVKIYSKNIGPNLFELFIKYDDMLNILKICYYSEGWLTIFLQTNQNCNKIRQIPISFLTHYAINFLFSNTDCFSENCTNTSKLSRLYSK